MRLSISPSSARQGRTRMKLNERPEWHALQNHYQQIKDVHLRELFKDDSQRFETFSMEDVGLLLDYSKNRITAETMKLLLALAESAGLRGAIESMFTGEKINFTETRAVLHVALRNRSGSPIRVDGQDVMPAVNAVGSYKSLSTVERAFRSLKTVDLKVRPIRHRLSTRVRAHVFLCMLAYYVEWHMRQALAPLLFDDTERDTAAAMRKSVVAPAQRSPQALRKIRTKRTADGYPVQSFRSMLQVLASLVKNRHQHTSSQFPAFDKITRPNPLQQRALDLLRVHL